MNPFLEGLLKALGQKTVEAVAGGFRGQSAPVQPAAPSRDLEALYQKGLQHIAAQPYFAMECLRIAAEGGHLESQAFYGIWLRSGTGCARNVEEGTGWLIAAANQGNERAIKALADARLFEDFSKITKRLGL